MIPAVRFVLAPVVVLGLLSVGATALVSGTTRSWAEKDLALRAELAVQGARQSLITHWGTERSTEVKVLLTEIARDERIMAAAACDRDGAFVAVTADYPVPFSCRDLIRHVRPTSDAPASEWWSWRSEVALPGGLVHVSAIPVVDRTQPLGFVAVVQDLSFATRREAQGRLVIFIAFVVLSLVAAAVTLVSAHLSWRGWNRELRRLLQGGEQRPEFQPLLRDMRALVERTVAEREVDAQGTWTPERLKQTLRRHLEGERVVIIANREPYIHERAPDGGVMVTHPASGLVSALEPVMRACSGVWVAHGSGSADRETADANGRVRVPPGEESYVVRRVWLSPEEEKGYYYGFANEGLWPLCHLAHTRPVFRADDWKHYQAVNRRFAEAACAEVDGDDPIILVQDYHFALVPAFIRERLPRATILTFWHIPWPNSERFGICPWRDEILTGFLGSSIVGFHTQAHCNNFIDAIDCFLEARIDRERVAVVQQGRPTLVRPYPISIEWPNRWLTDLPAVPECRSSVLAELGLREDALLGVGVDRLDYTKGIEERLLAVERLLERVPALRGKFTFVQLGAPSRSAIEEYRRLAENVERTAARINERFGEGAYRPIIVLRAHHEPPTVFRYYRAADLCYVSSLHDGMNLVAKEFVSAREDERGVLVLSQFTGAARELTEALIVNPYDLEETSAALETALTMSPREQRQRMRAMRSLLTHFNVYRWAGRMLADAAQLRQRDRLTGRLAEGPDLSGPMVL